MSAERSQILVVEDDRAVRLQLGALLEAAGLAAHLASSGETALALLEGFTPDALLVDLALPGMPGLEVLRRVSARLRHVAAIVLTSSREAETAVECMKSGAYDYLVKPIDEPKLLTTVANALRHRRLALAVESLQREARQRGLEARVPAPAAIALFRRVDRAAETDVSVLVRGAPGPEREAVAHGVHRGSSRAAGPLVVFECAGLPQERHAAELLGAVSAAAGGTLLVEDVEALSPEVQERLAGAMAAASETRVHGGAGHDFRAVATTAVDLAGRVRDGRFRGDLYMRLAVFELAAPDAPLPAEGPLTLIDRERQAILEALERSGGNRAAASRELGIGRATLYRKLAEYGIA
jgi:DNA-binding NtrC family response regulator